METCSRAQLIEQRILLKTEEEASLISPTVDSLDYIDCILDQRLYKAKLKSNRVLFRTGLTTKTLDISAGRLAMSSRSRKKQGENI